MHGSRRQPGSSADAGKVVRPEVNLWGISFSQGLFNMTSDSGLFRDSPSVPGQAARLPLYEAKMVHQFEHRWATFVPTPGVANDDWPSRDCTPAERSESSYQPSPRHWVEEREVLARIARVPTRVARAWLALHAAVEGVDTTAREAALDTLLLALAQWVAGELFHREAGATPAADGWTPSQAQPHVAPTEVQLKARFPRLNDLLRGEGLTTKKALTEFPKWATQNQHARLPDDELATLAEVLRDGALAEALRSLLDHWMDRRSPRWLMGWRDITGVEKVRTVIGTVIPRLGVGHTLPLYFSPKDAALQSCLLGNWQSMTFDYVARQKVGGTHLTYGYLKQFPVLPPDRYSEADIAFIVPRVLELTYTAYDLHAWGQDLLAYDPRPAAEQGQPFAWNSERRAQLRAELDAYYARLYGVNRDELRYILDPKDVMGEDYPSETFRVLKESEIRAYGEYRTRRLVLEAWDQQSAMLSGGTPATPAQYSAHGMIRDADEGKLAGLVVSLVAQQATGCSLAELQSLVASLATAEHHLEQLDGRRLVDLRSSLGASSWTQLLTRMHRMVLARATHLAMEVTQRAHVCDGREVAREQGAQNPIGFEARRALAQRLQAGHQLVVQRGELGLCLGGILWQLARGQLREPRDELFILQRR